MAELKIGFDVYPHGIKKVNGEVMAVFKMVLAFDNIEKLKADGVFRHNNIFQAIAAQSAGKWGYVITPAANSAPARLTVEQSAGQEIAFYTQNTAGEYTDMPATAASFGMLKKGGQLAPAWDFWNDDIRFYSLESADTYLSAYNNAQPVLVNNTFRGISKDIDTAADRTRLFIEKKLNANRDVKASEKTQYAADLKAFLSQVYNEPVVAESRFGLIREFHVPANKLLAQTNGIYTLEIKNAAETHTCAQCAIKEMSGKWYNGNARYFLTEEDFSLEALYHDPQKERDQAERRTNGEADVKLPHPDGLYVKVTYRNVVNNEPKSGIIDPFQQPGIDGFNVLVRQMKKEGKEYKKEYIYSPSLHEKRITLNGMGKMPAFLTSGSLTPKCELLVGDNQSRSDVLVALKGDNLIVNRNIDENKIKSVDEKASTATGIKVTGETVNEDRFILDKLFRTEEFLVEGSMRPINIFEGRKDLYLRTTTPLEYCIPSRLEFKPTDERLGYLLTAEDLMAVERPAISAEIKEPTHKVLPIKAPAILDNEEHGPEQEFMDGHTHLRLDIKNEVLEQRFVYPPAIGWEDFKLLGYLKPERLKRNPKEDMTRSDFIRRCVQLEERSAKALPKSFAQGSVLYLADPRCKGFYVAAADYHTLSALRKNANVGKFSLFNGKQNYPYFDQLRPLPVKVSHNKGNKTISFQQGSAPLALADGIYNFKIYAVDEAPAQTPAACSTLALYNATDFKVSIVNKPARPVVKSATPNAKTVKLLAERISASQLDAQQPDPSVTSRWHLTVPFAQDHATWKSVKYLEETTVFRLPPAGSGFYANNPEGPWKAKYPLLHEELPYEAFLATEGSIEQNIKDESGLIEDMWPQSITITCNISEAARDVLGDTKLFSFRLNEQYEVTCSLNKTGADKYSVSLNDLKLPGNATSCRVSFDKSTSRFYFTYGGEKKPLDKAPYPSLTANDFVVPHNVLLAVQHDAASELKFERSADYVIASDLRTKHYRKKKVRALGSSIFQAYHPKTDNEFTLGATAVNDIEVEIRNNTLPEKPRLDARILLKHAVNKFWNNGSKINTTEQIVQLLLDEDFCTESENTVGIVLSRHTLQAATNRYARVENPENASEIGEDITKLVEEDGWNEKTMLEMVQRTGLPPVLKKYYPNIESLQRYMIDGDIYEVLEARPFFNYQLRKWQVLVPLKYFDIAETIFFKFVVLKIAKGQAMETGEATFLNGQRYSYKTDTSGTNLSAFSNAAHLPVYSKKQFKLTKVANTLTLTSSLQSRYKDRVYFAMMLNRRPDAAVILHSSLGGQVPVNHATFSSMQDFGAEGIDQVNKGKILMFHLDKPLKMQFTSGVALIVMEFEIHANLWIKGKFAQPDSDSVQTSREFLHQVPRFVDSFHPLFDVEGIRLISSTEFTL